MKRNYDIICMGTAIVDSVIKGFEPDPVSASGYRAKDCSLHAGGEAVNASCAAAKLGNSTAICCHIGDDVAGDIIKRELDICGVSTRFVRHSKDHPTPVTTMFVNDDGTRKSITNLAHRYNFHPENDLSFLKEAGSIIIGSLFRAPFDDPQIIKEIVCRAKQEGLTVFADTKLPNFNVLSLDDISESLRYIDYITPNEAEAEYYTRKNSPEEMADVFLDAGVKNVIIKLGERGCYMKNASGGICIPAYSIKAVDATGAGDNFIAGFATRILEGAAVHEALRFANACGAICTKEAGAGTALRDRRQVEKFMSDNI